MRRPGASGSGKADVLFDLRDLDSTGVIPTTNAPNGANAGGGSKFNNVPRWFETVYTAGAGGQNVFSITPRGVVALTQGNTNGEVGRGAPLWSMPFWRNLTQFPTTYRPARRFIGAISVIRNGAPSNTTPCMFRFARQSIQLSSSVAGGGMCGIELMSLPTLNGGRWTPRYQLTPMGAIVNGSDSGVAASSPARLEIEYNEATPSIIVRVNRVTCLTLTGLANMPVPEAAFPTTLTSSASGHFYASFGSGSPTSTVVAGAYDEFWDARFRIVDTQAAE